MAHVAISTKNQYFWADVFLDLAGEASNYI